MPHKFGPHFVPNILHLDWPVCIVYGMEKTDTDYAVQMGKWVEARCLKRVVDHGKPMPQKVKDWLDEGGYSPAGPDTDPTTRVMRWLTRTIDDPDWAE